VNRLSGYPRSDSTWCSRAGPLALALALLAAGCAPKTPTQSGLASWYGRELAGRPTASGEPFRPARRTAAHRSLPFGSLVEVTRVDTGSTVRVRINDRGPYVDGRIIDLSRRAARKIDMIDAGVVKVEVRVVGCRPRGSCGGR
jgi:rare lipoprotein A